MFLQWELNLKNFMIFLLQVLLKKNNNNYIFHYNSPVEIVILHKILLSLNSRMLPIFVQNIYSLQYIIFILIKIFLNKL